jgi:hypothetical protein
MWLLYWCYGIASVLVLMFVLFLLYSQLMKSPNTSRFWTTQPILTSSTNKPIGELIVADKFGHGTDGNEPADAVSVNIVNTNTNRANALKINTIKIQPCLLNDLAITEAECRFLADHYHPEWKPDVSQLNLIFTAYPRDYNCYKTIAFIGNEMVGMITSRPIECYLNGSEIKSNDCTKWFDCNKVLYADLLCVHSDYRQQHIAPTIIQQHYAGQARSHAEIFKREGEEESGFSAALKPIVRYAVHGFAVADLIRPLPNSTALAPLLPPLTPLSLWSKSKQLRKWCLWSCIFYRRFNGSSDTMLLAPPKRVLKQLINKHQLFIYGDNGAIFAFRTTNMSTDENHWLGYCSGSHCPAHMSPGRFAINWIRAVAAFVQHPAHQGRPISHIGVEMLSDNGLLMEALQQQQLLPQTTSTSSYYGYNLVHPTHLIGSNVLVVGL